MFGLKTILHSLLFLLHHYTGYTILKDEFWVKKAIAFLSLPLQNIQSAHFQKQLKKRELW